MRINTERLKSIRTYWKILACISCFFFTGSTLGFADARSDAQLRCGKQLGFAGIAVKNNSGGQSKWVCGCRGAFMWNQNRSACIKRQPNGADTANQQPPNDDQEQSNAEGDNNQSQEAPPVVRISPKKTGETPPSGRTRQDVQLMCSKRLGFAGIAVKDTANGQTNWVCNCRSAFTWNQDGSACVKRQSNGGNTADQQAPYSEEEDNNQPPVVRTPRKKVKRVPPPRRKKTVVKKKKRVVRSKSATAHGYCRRKYGRRLVRVNVKGSKFYCHYKGKNAVGPNPRIKWKKIRFNNLR